MGRKSSILIDLEFNGQNKSSQNSIVKLVEKLSVLTELLGSEFVQT